MTLRTALLLGLLLPSIASGQSELRPDDHCTTGDLKPNIHGWYPRLGNHNKPAESSLLCQFRAFWGDVPEDICFCEHDLFMAGSMWSEHRLYGGWDVFEPQEFVELLDMYIVPGPDAAPYTETFVTNVHGAPAHECGYEDDQGNCYDPYVVPLVQKQAVAVFRDLPPGNYYVVDVLDHPVEELFGFEFEDVQTRFRVLPHDVAHGLGRPTVGWLGSVNCPTEDDCTNGLDDDGDDRIDCADPSCWADDACHELGPECTDGDDNDGDDAADCDDSDCFFTEVCFPVATVPGRVEAEMYNLGGQGVGYSDADPWNEGGAFRDDGVDITQAADGFAVGWSVTGEWLRYDLDVAVGGSYALAAYVASGCAGGCPWPKAIGVSIDGAHVADFTFGDTGGWSAFEEVPASSTVDLDAGLHLLELEIVADGLDLDWVDFALVGSP